MSSVAYEGQESLFGRALIAIARKLAPRDLRGGIALRLPSGGTHRLGFARDGVACDLSLANYRPLWAAMRRGALGFAESYMAGDLDSSNITAVMQFYLQNRHVLDDAAKPVFFRSQFDRIFHMLRANTRRGSQRNISAHYDLGNAFYALWLDATMSYSSGYFGAGAATLEEAQRAKYALVLDALELERGARILEIGCGWGGFAEAAADRGHRVTGLTISSEQLSWARSRLDEQAEFHFQDYRDSTGRYDAVASIEMIEAVGEANWPAYFAVLRDRLLAGRSAVVQAITIDEPLYDRYRTGADFIQRYIFPGGMLPTRSAMQVHARNAGLAFETVATFGQDYARTLAQWRDRFEASWPQISGLGFDDAFRRRWWFYLCYCEAGFLDGAIDVGIYRFRREG